MEWSCVTCAHGERSHEGCLHPEGPCVTDHPDGRRFIRAEALGYKQITWREAGYAEFERVASLSAAERAEIIQRIRDSHNPGT